MFCQRAVWCQGFDKAFEALDIDGVSGQVLDRLTKEVAA